MNDERFWKAIGSTFSSKNTSPQLEYEFLQRNVQARETAVFNVAEFLSSRGHFYVTREIAATDLFVEKAQLLLESRARSMMNFAVSSLGIGIVLLILLTSFYFSEIDKLFMIKTNTPEELIASIFKNATIFGLYFAPIYLSVSLFRAFLHESTIINNRIHSLRLGRLFVYIKYSSISEDKQLNHIRKEMSANDLEQAFGWNIETSTAFKDIDAKYVTKTLLGQAIDAISKFAQRK